MKTGLAGFAIRIFASNLKQLGGEAKMQASCRRRNKN